MNKEDALWHKWKETKDDGDYDKVFQALQPIISQKVQAYKRYPVDDGIVRANATKHVIKGITTYNPNRGATLKTHIFNTLRRLDRDIGGHQNFAWVPERRRLRVETFQKVSREFHERTGRHATTQELADELNWSLAEVSRMNREMRGQVSEATNEALSQFSFDRPGARANNALSYVYTELTPQEKTVFEHLYGYGGKEELKTNRELARAAKLSPSQVGNIRKRIAQKLEPFLSKEN